MSDLRVLVAAAGRGSRAGLPYPKTLYPVQGVPILVRILKLMAPYDPCPTVIVSPSGKQDVAATVTGHGHDAHLVVQPEPTGMGDAVLMFDHASAADETQNLLLVWGDIPFIQPQTVASVVEAHRSNRNDFTFATRRVNLAYTLVARDREGAVTGVVETRELGGLGSQAGEREIGLFVFRKKPVFDLLRANLPGRTGRATGEHGFLYVIAHLAARGFRIEALPVATEQDLISLNALTDLGEFK